MQEVYLWGNVMIRGLEKWLTPYALIMPINYLVYWDDDDDGD